MARRERGRISVFPTTSLAENASPELMQAIRAFAEKHDLGYTIHLGQSRWEVEYMLDITACFRPLSSRVMASLGRGFLPRIAGTSKRPKWSCWENQARSSRIRQPWRGTAE